MRQKTMLQLGFILASLYCWGDLRAQDPVFSQFYNARPYLNPALVGLEPGLALNLNYRDQWTRVPGQFTTTWAALDAQELGGGLGLSLYKNTEGEGMLSTQSGTFYYSYIVPLLSKKRHKLVNLHMGFNGGYVQKTIDWERLIFSDQLDPVYGLVYPTNAVPIIQNVGYFDVGLGVATRFDHRLKLGKHFKRQLRSIVGLSVQHLCNSDESLQGIVTRTPMRFTVHAGTEIPIMIYKGVGRKITWIPNARFDYQGGIKTITYGFNAVFLQFNMGLFYQNTQPLVDARNTNALIGSVGWRGKISHAVNIQLGYSYDANVSGLSSRTAGAHEVSVRLIFPKVQIFKERKGAGKKILDCNSFF